MQLLFIIDCLRNEVQRNSHRTLPETMNTNQVCSITQFRTIVLTYFKRGIVTSFKCGGKGKSCFYNFPKPTTPVTLYVNVSQWQVLMFHNISALHLLFSRVLNNWQDDPLSCCWIRFQWPPKGRLWCPPTRRKLLYILFNQSLAVWR